MIRRKSGLKRYAAFDPGSQRMGWCWGTGDGLPQAGAWRIPVTPPGVVGPMMVDIDARLRELFDEARPDVVAFEHPILTRWDTCEPLRKTYGIGDLIEMHCAWRDIPCLKFSVKAVKKELAGMATADKDAMVAAAEKLGVVLPATKAAGREDAADALGVWLLLLRSQDRLRSQWFDKRLWSARGTLL